MGTLLRSALLYVCILAGSASAGTVPQADVLFDKGLFDKAAVAYEEAAAASSGPERLKAVYRAVESKALSFAYAEAVQRLLQEPLPKDPLWRARFLLLKAELFRTYLAQYGHGLPQDRQEGEADVTKWNAAQWHEQIKAAYELLWPLRGTLLYVPLKEEGYFVRPGNPAEDVPTLWDFTVYRWTDYLLDQSPSGEALPAAERFIAPEYAAVLDFNGSPAEQAAALMAEASSSGNDGPRRKAAELWKLKRLQIPFWHGDRVSLSGDIKPLRDKAVKTLLSLMDIFAVPDNKAEAAAQAAEFLEQGKGYKEAVELCRKADALWHGSLGAKKCARLKARIEMPVLSLSAHNAPPDGKRAFSLTARNLEKVYCRLYRTSQQELMRLSRRSGERGYRYLLSLDGEKALTDNFLRRRPDKEWTVSPQYAAPYETVSFDADAPSSSAGLYVLAVSDDDGFKPGQSLVRGAIVNCTEFFLLGSAGVRGKPEEFFLPPLAGGREISPDGFHLYAVNALSGAALRGAAVRAYYSRNGQNSGEYALTTDQYGMASVKTPFTLAHGRSNSFGLSPLAEYGRSLAYWQSDLWFGHSLPEPVEVFVETDRPVYRPGQEVRFKATALAKAYGGYETLGSSVTVRVSAMDANYTAFYSAEFKSNGMGSVAGSFKIPQGRLLGSYSVRAEISGYGGNHSGAANFGVEEYRRPEFELKLEEAKTAWRYGRKASVRGLASYYYGGAVPQAQVSYKIYRQRYVPWYARWAYWFAPDTARKEVGSGSLLTGTDGKFQITFVPEPEPGDAGALPATFEVEASARDEGGRIISDSKTYRAGMKAFVFKTDLPAGFARPDSVYDIPVRLMNLNEAQVAGRGRYALYRLSPRIEDKGVYGTESHHRGGFIQQPLEWVMKDTPDGEKVLSGEFLFGEVGAEHVRLKNLPEGVYRLSLKADDIWGGESEQSLIVVSAGAQPKLPLPSVALPEYKTCQVGETARILAGSSALKGVLYAEIWAGNYLLGRQAFQGGGLRLLEIPVTAEHRGGFTVRWFGASDFRIYSAQAAIDVPRPEKELAVALDAPKQLEPGAQSQWTLSVKDSAGKPASGEALVKVYDRSLEYYAKDGGFWLDALYPANGGTGQAALPFYNTYSVALSLKPGLLSSLISKMGEYIAVPRPPELALSSSRMGGGRRFKSLGAGALMEYSMARAAPNAAPVMAEAMADSAGAPSAGGGGAPAPQPQAAAVRSDFSETAYFNPQLPFKNGAGVIKLRMPQRLTDWKVSVSALTADVKRGKLSAQVRTRKEFMARLEMPRFFREGDRGVVKALVHNDTDEAIKASVTLQLEEEGVSALGKFGVKEAALRLELKPGEIKAAQWEISAPAGVAVYKARVLARSGRYSDAEEKDLPVLPSRQRLVASQLKALDGAASTELALEELLERDSTREMESLHLQADPQLALSILNSLPFLVHYPYECTEQLVNRYVPLSIVNKVYSRYPALAAAAAKIPGRNTITPAWERDNPARMSALLETPWEELSRGRESPWPATDMLKPALVKEEQSAALEKLASYQLENGAFPWFPGGHEDLYMTLYALEGLAQAQSYGVPAPREMAVRAMAYVNSELPQRLKPETEPVALMLYASYVLTSFPKSWDPESYANARQWLEYAAQHDNAMTAYGKAHAALAWARLGDRKRSDAYLDRALDGAKKDPVSGIYWAPEKISWLWYNDSVEKHAFLLRALAVLRPGDSSVGGLTQWLLFNRKGNEWKSTRASAAAIYSLLEVLKSRGALDKDEAFSINWGPQKLEARVHAQDWLEKPLRWSRYGSDASQQYAKAGISKTGPGLAFVSLTGIYSTEELARKSPEGMLNVGRRYFLRVKRGKEYALEPLRSGDTVAAGDELEVHLSIVCRSQFEYVQLKDPKGAGFEAETLISGWQWDGLSRYEEPRDSLTNFFVPWLPHGEYTLKYRLRPTTPGSYRIGAAVLQSMYAPELGAHSDGMLLHVK